MDNITIDYKGFDQKKKDLKEKVKTKFHSAKDWVIKNKEMIITSAPIVIGGLTTIIKVVGKRSNLRKEENLKDLYCYDRSLGHYWKLKRELSSREWIEVDRRKKNGERLSDILDDMRVLD